MSQTVAQNLVSLMIDAGIKRIYGIVGDSANSLVDAIHHSDGQIEFINVRNEEAGAFAAGADADIVVYDPAADHTLHAADMVSRCDYTPFEGFRTSGSIAAVCDRDAVIAVAGGGKRELLDRRISRELEELMSTRGQYAADSCTLPVVDTDERYAVAVAAPILSEGDVLGCVLFVAAHGDGPAGETERKLAQAVSGFLGKQMES